MYAILYLPSNSFRHIIIYIKYLTVSLTAQQKLHYILIGMNEAKTSKKKKAGFVIDCSEYAIFTISSALYILNVVSNCYVRLVTLLD